MRHFMVFLTLVAMLVASRSATAVQQTTVGNAKVVVKTVTGIVETAVRTLELQDDVYHNERIETGDESATKLIFLDSTTVTLGPNSELILDRFVYDPKRSSGSFVMTATKGAFRFASGKLPSKAYRIHTPAATLGVRGTVFEVRVTGLKGPDGAARVAVDVRLDSGGLDITTCDGRRLRLEAGATTRILESEACDLR